MAKVTIRGRFPAGAKVELIERRGDYFHPGAGTVVDSGKVSGDSEVSFTGLDEGATFWVAGEVDGVWRHAAVTAKREGLVSFGAEGKRAAQRPSGLEAQPSQGLTAPLMVGDKRVAGPEEAMPGRVEQRFAGQDIGKPTPKDAREQEPNPAPRQEDVKGGTPQRSETITGAATPTSDDEPQPQPKQDDVRKGTPQRSETEVGIATVVPEGEQVPAARQEDVSDRVRQRSSTETGQAEPIPTESPVAQAKERDSAEAKARGSSPAKPERKRTTGSKAKRSTSRSRSKR